MSIARSHCSGLRARLLRSTVVAVVCAVCTWEIATVRAGEATPQVPQVGRSIESFELRDFYGKVHRLQDYAQHKYLVIAFLGTDCPLVKLYAPRLVELADEFVSQGVGFLAINSNYQDSVTEIASFAQRNQIDFPILKDPDSAVADRLGAERTPEVFVLDADRIVRYWGRIDDQFGIGYQKDKPSRRDLAEALTELLAGKAVSQPSVPAPGCLIGRTQKVEPRGEITYSKHIARVMQNRCLECHREGAIAPFPLTSYEEVTGWADMICEVIDQGRMPPWLANPEYGKFSNECRIEDDEKNLIRTWVKNGCPPGDTADLPAPREFYEGWRMGQPDQVIYITEQPFQVPAEGVVDYQHFAVDLGLTEDAWLQGTEPRPGNLSVVHHIVCFIQPPGSDGVIAFGNRLAGVYAPGTPPWMFPEGAAIRVPAGSKIVFQMHYTPNGRPAEDRSFVGLKWAKPESVKRQALSLMAPNFWLKIPPHADNHEVAAKFRVKRDLLLLNLFPHMHLRGKDFKFVLEYPDGHRETLLDVPRYDFNWQLRYDLAEPKLLPKGSKLHAIGHFDNSANNPSNPNPDQLVEFGEQTWEEMLVGFFTAASAEEDVVDGVVTKKHSDDERIPRERDDATGGE
jgi:peroxiredoxin